MIGSALTAHSLAGTKLVQPATGVWVGVVTKITSGFERPSGRILSFIRVASKVLECISR